MGRNLLLNVMIILSAAAGACFVTQGVVEADTIPPDVAVDQAASQADPTSVAPIRFTVVFTEPVIGFETGDIQLSGTAGATEAVVTGSDATYAVDVSGMTAPGTVIAAIAAGVCTDVDLNPNTASTSTDNTVTLNALSLTYGAGPGGYIVGQVRQAVAYGQDGAVVSASAAPGYAFVDWSDGQTSRIRSESAVTANLDVTANFTLAVAETPPAGTVFHARQGGTGDGSSWATAGDLQAMVNAAQPGDEVWVAAGAYTGTADPVLAMKAGVAVYGGFAGTETARWQRSITGNITMIFGEDLRRGVTGADGALLDGFIVTRGFADYGGGMRNGEGETIVSNCAFIQNMATEDGGGMYNSNADTVVVNCQFTKNTAFDDGGGMYNNFASPALTNCTFYDNTAETGYGGGVYSNRNTPLLTNCTIHKNTAVLFGGGLFSQSASPVVTNCIIWGNVEIDSPMKSDVDGGSPVITYSCIEGGYPGAGNIDADPMFVDAVGHLSLLAGSPCVDTGTPVGAPGADILGVYRPQGGGHDMGAYELDATPPVLTIDQAVTQIDPTNDSPILFTVLFREPVTGFATGDVSLSGTASAAVGTVTGFGAVYSVAVSGMMNPGTVIGNIVAGVCTDQAGNLNTASTSIDNTVIYGSHTLTYLAGEGGSILGDADQSVFYSFDGEPVTAQPATGYHFLRWSDARTDNPRADLDVTSDITVTAIFEINTYTLTYSAGENGVIDGPTPQTVDHGSDGETVTAVPNFGYHFVNWSDGSTDNPRTDVNVTGPITVTANFIINTYPLAYTAGANGSIEGPSTQMVDHGSDGATVTAVPAEGYHFTDWSDGSTANPRTDVNVTGPITVTANFAINTYPLSYAAGENGTVTGPAEQTVNYGGNGEPVTAVPAEGYHFTGWSDGSSANPRTDVNVTGPIAVTANFAINTYILTYLADGNGAITGPSPQTAAHGSSGETVIAVPNSGYRFAGWSDGNTANPRTDINVTGPITVTANFAINAYILTYLADGNGAVTGPSPQTVNHGGNGETVNAVPNSGYHFANWSDGSTANPRTDTNVVNDITVTAVFALNAVEGEGEAPAEGEGEPEIQVPDVVLLSLGDADALVEAAGLIVGEVSEECSDEVPEGAVISQDPEAGTVVEALTPVNLVISTGECPCSCGAFCTVDWGNLFLGILAVLVLLIISMFALGGAGAFPK